MCSFTASGYCSLNFVEKILVDGEHYSDLDDDLGDGVAFPNPCWNACWNPACVELN